MVDVHRIRLRGPWQYEPLTRLTRDATGRVQSSGADLPPPGVMKMPADWGLQLGSDFRGRVRYRRHFNCPTALESHETVWLVIEAVDLSAEVFLSAQPLGTIQPDASATRFNVTALLRPRNELIVEVELPPLAEEQERQLRPGRQNQPGGLIGEVRLEIHNR